MYYTKTFEEFIKYNEKELYSLVGSICKKYEITSIDDIVQDVYLHLYTHKIIEKYNPFLKGYKTAKISTYLYPILKNIIRSRRKYSDFRYYKSRWTTYKNPKYENESFTDSDDDIELAMKYESMASDYRNIMSESSLSSNPDDLSFELDSFGRYLKTKNKKFCLKKRRDKSKKRNGCSLTKIYFMFKKGMNVHEIAQYYGVSDTFISNLKRIIRDEMQKYGLNCNCSHD